MTKRLENVKPAEHWVNGMKILFFFFRNMNIQKKMENITNFINNKGSTMRSHIYPVRLSILQLVRCGAPEL